MNLKEHLLELMEEYFKDKEKLFNYKVFERNEISSAGEFEIPVFKFNDKLEPLQQTIGVLLLTLLKEKKYNVVNEVIEDKKLFVLEERFKLDNHITAYTDLCDISLYIGNGWIITLFEINYNHLLSLFQNDPYKLMLFLYFSVQNAFLDTKNLYYDINPDPRNPYYMIFSYISAFTLDTIYYANYIFETYGICPLDKFNKSLKTKAKPLYNALNKLNKERFNAGKNISNSEITKPSEVKRKRGRPRKQEINNIN